MTSGADIVFKFMQKYFVTFVILKFAKYFRSLNVMSEIMYVNFCMCEFIFLPYLTPHEALHCLYQNSEASLQRS